MGIGVIVRDAMGEVSTCLFSPCPFYCTLLIAECSALLRTLEFWVEQSINTIELEGDAQIIIQALKKDNECLTWYGELIEEVKCYLRNQPSGEGSSTAHALAKHGLIIT